LTAYETESSIHVIRSYSKRRGAEQTVQPKNLRFIKKKKKTKALKGKGEQTGRTQKPSAVPELSEDDGMRRRKRQDDVCGS
jgi:hypothetical protein